MENEMMNNMDTMTENLTDAMPEVDNLVPSVDENHAEMPSASGNFGKTAVFMLAGAAAAHNLNLAASAAGVPGGGQWAVILGLAVTFAIGWFKREKIALAIG